MKLLLDTCTFLWLISDKSKLSRAATDLFSDPLSRVYLSAASSWEIAIKHRSGKLSLRLPPETYVPQCREALELEELAVDEAAALFTSSLPLHHRDPFDRLLVAQAATRGLTILTPDPLIAQYPVETVW